MAKNKTTKKPSVKRSTSMVVSKEFTPQIANLVMFLEISKEQIIELVSGLSKKELDYVHDPTTPTIGNLLKHMACVEYWFRITTFQNRPLTKQEREFWAGCLPLQLLDRVIHNNQLIYYIDLWEQVRAKTLQAFKDKDDKWLYQKTGEYNNYFAWYHVMQDHLCHLGQIKAIRARMPAVRKNGGRKKKQAEDE